MASRNLNYLVSEQDASNWRVESAATLAVDEGKKQSIFQSIFDRSSALVIILILSPIFLAVSLFIYFRSGGPIFYSQSRVGRGGNLFQILKFRTMVVGAHSMKSELKHMNFMTGPFFKIKDDPRLTPEGKFLRRWSLDELPQLFNVLKGDMSLVGPRPMLPEEIMQLNCRDILSVNPGVTGLWQVAGRSEVFDFRTKLAMDRIYVKKKSTRYDLLILVRTVGAVLKTRGAC